MTPIPLNELGLWPGHHRAALWWLGLLYRRPRQVWEALGGMGRPRALMSAAGLYLHALLWLVLLAILSRLLLFGLLAVLAEDSPEPSAKLTPPENLLWHLRELARGLASGLAFGLALTRAYYLPLHLLLVWPAPQCRRYPLHPVAWDDLCGVPFPGLDRLLVAFAEVDRTAAEAEIERLIDTYPAQRLRALEARAALIARDAGAESNLAMLDLRTAALPEGEEGFLRDVPRLKAMIPEIAQAQRRLDAARVPAFRAPLAAVLVQAVETFRSNVAGLRYPLAGAFRAAAARWLEVARGQRAEAECMLDTTPAPQVFRAGKPVDRGQEAFVLRLPAIEELQGQITLATGSPGLLLYGRRRMGKSTLIRNLQPFRLTSASLPRQCKTQVRPVRCLGWSSIYFTQSRQRGTLP